MILNAFGGVGISTAARHLDLSCADVELRDDIQATLDLLGMAAPTLDAWDFDSLREQNADIMWAYPPFPKDTTPETVARLTRERVWDDLSVLRELDGVGDSLLPVAYAMRFLPRVVIFEQEPVWQPFFFELAPLLREVGYNVWEGFVHAEQFGVPQLRTRRYIIARRDGLPAEPPMPEFAQFNHQNPADLGGLPRWRSPSDVLGLSPDLWLSSDEFCSPMTVPTRTLTPLATNLRVLNAYDEGISAQDRLLYRDFVVSPVMTVGDTTELADAPHERPLSVEEAAALQGFPTSVKFSGFRKSAFTDLTRATPPPVVEAVLKAVA